jgi:hypothetical protein
LLDVALLQQARADHEEARARLVGAKGALFFREPRDLDRSGKRVHLRQVEAETRFEPLQRIEGSQSHD